MLSTTENHIQRLRQKYPIGLNVKLIKTDEEGKPHEATGLVTGVDETGNIAIHLNEVIPEDKIVNMSSARLPDLGRLRRKALDIIYNESDVIEALREHYGKGEHDNNVPLNISCEIFTQTWASAGTAFDVDKYNVPTISQSVMTTAYTVVFCENTTDVYIIFVDDLLYGVIKNPTRKFFADLKARNLLPISKATKEY